jgi:hypothetical protein
MCKEGKEEEIEPLTMVSEYSTTVESSTIFVVAAPKEGWN